MPTAASGSKRRIQPRITRMTRMGERMKEKEWRKALGRFGTALDGAVDGALRQFVQAQGRSRRHAGPLLFGEAGGDPKGKSFADWLLCVRRDDVKRLAEVYDSRLAEWREGKAAMA